MKQLSFVCPICNEKDVSFDENFEYCFHCGKYFAKIGKKMIPVTIKSFNPEIAVDIDVEGSIVNENEITIQCRPHLNTTEQEKEDENFTCMIQEHGYNQENTVPRYIPTKIENEWYIFGWICGARLKKRNSSYYKNTDNHVLIELLVEDDGNWFLSERPNFSSAWIEDYKKVIEITEKFLKNEEIFELDIYDSVPCGYKYKN